MPLPLEPESRVSEELAAVMEAIANDPDLDEPVTLALVRDKLRQRLAAEGVEASRHEFGDEQSLYAEVEAQPDEGPPPLEVKFTVLVEDNQGKVECEWNFGDNTPMLNTLEPQHVFQNEGDYEVIATCRDEKGVSGEGDIDLFVETEN